jgi:hypothetical protein
MPPPSRPRRTHHPTAPTTPPGTVPPTPTRRVWARPTVVWVRAASWEASRARCPTRPGAARMVRRAGCSCPRRWQPTVTCSTTGAPPASSPTGYAAPSSPATGPVAGPAATGPPPGPTCTTSSPSPRAARPRSRTSSSSAAGITTGSTNRLARQTPPRRHPRDHHPRRPQPHQPTTTPVSSHRSGITRIRQCGRRRRAVTVRRCQRAQARHIVVLVRLTERRSRHFGGLRHAWLTLAHPTARGHASRSRGCLQRRSGG